MNSTGHKSIENEQDAGNSARWVTLGIALMAGLIPLAMVPGWSLYFDVAPKIAVLLCGTALLLLNFQRLELSVTRVINTRAGRILAACLTLQLLSLVVSTCFSSNWVISLFGTGWRRFGTIEHFAILLFAFLAAAHLTGEASRLAVLLRVLCVSAMLLGAYGILQYLGWDPFQNSEGYQSLFGKLRIVRPPGTLGNATYFANYLSFLLFALTGSAIAERSTPWRIAAIASVDRKSVV